MARHILIVGDELDTTEVVSHGLKALGCTVETETDTTQVMARLDMQAYTGIILMVTIPGARWVTLLQQLRRCGIAIPVIAIPEDTIDDELLQEGANAVLRMPCEGRELKRVFQQAIPPTPAELMRDQSGGESTIQQQALRLAKAGDFLGARNAIALLDDENNQRWASIQLLSYHVQAGDLEGAKATVHSTPSLRIGGHWVRCMTNALVHAGDVRGAWALADHLAYAEERSFAKAMIVAQQIAAGNLDGAQATYRRFSPRERTGRDLAAGALAQALMTAGNLEEALRVVCDMEPGEVRMGALKGIFHPLIRRGDRAEVERLAAGLDNEELKQQAREVIQIFEPGGETHTDGFSAYKMNFTHDTFANLYPVE